MEEQLPTTPAEASCISELQEAFGPLVVTRRRKSHTESTTSSCSDTLPRWTGSFGLFHLPRELRDVIYYYYLHRPTGIYYTAHADQSFWEQKTKSDEIANLLVVSKQVYAEASKMLYLTNTIVLSTSYSSREESLKPLTGLLRVFPDRVARNLTWVRYTYRDVITRPYGPLRSRMGMHAKHNTAGETFLEILRDAHTLTEYFPRLVLLEAKWHPEPPVHEFLQPTDEVYKIANCWVEGVGEKSVVARWLNTMRRWLHGHNLVPLSCVRFSLSGFGISGFGHEFDLLVNEAYRRLIRERTIDDLEDSGRLWLEEMERTEASRRKKSRKKSVQCT